MREPKSASLPLCVVVLAIALSTVAGKTCNLGDYGAPFDDKDRDTAAVQTAIKDCPAGTIRFPRGRYFLKPFNMTSGQTLYLEDGAYLSASAAVEDWPIIAAFPSYGDGREKKGPQYSAFISAWHASDVAITGDGSGIIDGNGLVWWRRFYSKQLLHTRGRLVEFVYCKNVTVSKVHMRFSPFWTLHVYDSSGVNLHDFRVFNPVSPNTDGIDIDSTSNVAIRRVLITTPDDHISIKSGMQEYGRRYNKPSENIIIEDSVFEMGAGVGIGSAGAGGVRNVTVRNCAFSLVANVVRLKGNANNGGTVEDILYENLEMHGAYVGILLNPNYKNAEQTFPSVYRNIVVRNVTGYAVRAGELKCLEKSHCRNVTVASYQPYSLLGIVCANVEDASGNVPSWCGK